MNAKLAGILIQVGIVAIVLATGFFGFKYWLAQHDEAVATAAALEQSKKTGEATTDIAQDAGEGVRDQQHTDHVVTESRVTFHHAYEEAKHNDPSIDNWGDVSVPVQLRDLARERRLARERSGSAEARSRVDASRPGPEWPGPARGTD